MRVMLATICVNEMEWLPKLLAQHKDWPGLVSWVFVEGADPIYSRTNPTLVKNGLSTDGTTEFLEKNCYKLKDTYQTPFGGTMTHLGCYKSEQEFYHVKLPEVPEAGDQGKCYLRNAYLLMADEIKPDVIIQLDADEFYTKEDQKGVNELCETRLLAKRDYTAIMMKQRHIWNPWSQDGRSEQKTGGMFCLAPPTFSQEVVGGYWQVPHTRIWRYMSGMRHVRNHNWPESQGRFLTDLMLRCDLLTQGTLPQCIHLGYASSLRNRKAKHDYYKARGEGQEGGRTGKKRSMYLDCRDAYERWQPGDPLPHGAEVIPYTGPVPEVFQ